MSDKKYFHCSVPLCLEPLEENPWEEYAVLMQKMGADRIFLSAPGLRNNGKYGFEKFEEISAKLAELIPFFRRYGISVGFWMAPTLGWDALSEGGEAPYQTQVGPEGKAAEGIFCPLDEGFQEYFCTAMQIMAKSGVELIMLEDDYRLHLRPPHVPYGCFCPLHLEEFRKRSGMDLTREEIAKKVLYGKPNKVRDIWQETIGNSLLVLAEKAEKAVHEVNPDTRIGVTAVLSHWSHEGIEMPELLKKFAGSTKPFMRATGAPYWSHDPHYISNYIEYHRLQVHWLDGLDVEVVAEGDTYPHSRYYFSAATMHAFQQGLLASGITGMLNYGIALAPKPNHELGYVNKAADSLNHYEAICKFFPVDYVDSGVTALETRNNYKNVTMSEDTLESWPDESSSRFFMSRMGIPLAYGQKEGPVILSAYTAYGYSDEEIEELLKRGVVLDAVSAKWLTERGFDVGIDSISQADAPRFERYEDAEICGKHSGEHIWLIASGIGVFYHYQLKPGARVITSFVNSDKEVLYPGVVHYENKYGHRICLLPFEMYKIHGSRYSQTMLNYARQEQLTRSLAWVARKPLPVTLNEQPNVHLICRVSPAGERMAIAVQNITLDAMESVSLRLNPDICVGKEIELLLPGGEEILRSRDFTYENDGQYGYLNIPQSIPPMEMLSIGIRLK